MKRPIEKYGWEYTGISLRSECFEKLGHEIRVDHEGNLIMLHEEAGFDFEVLQAIYETALEIKRRIKYDNAYRYTKQEAIKLRDKLNEERKGKQYLWVISEVK